MVNPPKSAVKRTSQTVRRPKAVVVIGMHRSGTSALARVLNLLGCALPSKLNGANYGNEQGHWEAEDVNRVNDEIFASAGSSWNDWGPMNQDWVGSDLRASMLDKIAGVVEDHVALGPQFVMKDPRASRLADLWIEALEASKVEPLVVLSLRNPAEVVASLETRDLMSRDYGQLLWLRYTLDAEHFSRGTRRVVYRYQNLLENWHDETQRIKDALDVKFPRNSSKTHLEIEEFLNAKHQHHSVSDGSFLRDSAFSVWVRECYRVMLEWVTRGEDPEDYVVLDRIREALTDAYATFGRILLPMGMTGDYAAGSKLDAELAGQVEAYKRLSEQFEEGVAQARAQEQEAREREAELHGRLSAAAAETAELKEQLPAIRASAQEEQALAREREAELHGRLSAAAAETAELKEQLPAIRASAQEEQALALEREAELLERMEAMTLKSHGLDKDLGVALSQVAAGNEWRRFLEEEVKGSKKAFLDEAARASDLAGRLSSTESMLAQRDEELSQIWKQLALSENAVRELELMAEKDKDQLGDLQAKYSQAIRQLGELEANLASMDQAAGEHQEQLGAVQAALQSAEQESKEREQRIANARAAIAPEQEKGQITYSGMQWLGEAIAISRQFPKWWALLPSRSRRQRELEHLGRIGFFDAGEYLAMYPDVVDAGIDPLEHFIRHGIFEGRFITSRGQQIRFTNGHKANYSAVMDALDVGQHHRHGHADAHEPDVSDRQAENAEPAENYPEIPIVWDKDRLIIIDGIYPTPNNDAGSVEAVNFVQIFQRFGYQVYFVSTANFNHWDLNATAMEARKNLEDMGVFILDSRYAPNISELIRLKGGYFSVFFLSRIYSGGVFFEDIRTHTPRSRVIFNTVDLHGLRELREGKLKNDQVMINGSYQTLEREYHLTRMSDATIVVSFEEKKILDKELSDTNVHVIPLIREMPGTQVGFESRANIGFIGGFKHTPNIDAVEYFIADIWPLIRQSLPEAEFHVMGADMPEDMRSIAAPGVRMIGQVDDLQAAFDTLLMSVAPLRVGAGAKGKVVSSLSHGLPCVVSPVAAEGMALGGVLVGSDPAEFAERVVTLYRDRALWERLSRAGIAQVSKENSFETGVLRIEGLLSSIVKS
jgi:glycosyltransferase involved in cell wall biosynthesis